MIVTIPDRHPGRCTNLRHSRYGPGKMLRCLDYEGTPHTCAFEREVAPVTAGRLNSYTVPEPKPWVRPDSVALR